MSANQFRTAPAPGAKTSPQIATNGLSATASVLTAAARASLLLLVAEADRLRRLDEAEAEQAATAEKESAHA